MFFVLSIRAEKALSLAKNLTPGDAHLSDWAWFKDCRVMLTRPTFRSLRPQSSQFYRCPGCGEMVDGQKLSEVLEHHQHVLNPYQFLISRAEGKAHMTPKLKRI